MKAPRFIVLGLLLALSVGLLAACGGSDSTGSDAVSTGETTTASESGEAAGDDGLQVAAKEAALAEEVGELKVPPPLSGPAPKDIKVAMVMCPLPACKTDGEGFEAAAEALGWSVEPSVFELNPESYQKAMADAVEKAPDVLKFASVFPNAMIEPTLRKAQEDEMAIIQTTPMEGEGPDELVPGIVDGFPTFQKGGELGAIKVLADAGEPVDAIAAFDPAYGVLVKSAEGFQNKFEELCPECGYESLEVALAQPPPEQMSVITRYLAQNPDVKYVFFPVSDQGAPFGQALEAAGLADKVQYVTQTPNLSDLERIAAGTQLASIQVENFSGGYRAADLAARVLLDGNAGPEPNAVGYTRIITKDNVEPGKPVSPPGFPEAWLKTWGLEG